MKPLNLLLLIVFLLSSCAPAVNEVPTPVPTLTFTLVPTATQTPSPTPTLTPAPTQIGGGSGRLIFSYSSSEFKKDFPELEGDGHVFIANIDGTNIIPITKGLNGFNSLVSLSPDGTKAIISNIKSGLYVVNLNTLGAEPVKLAKGYSALWLDNSRIVYAGQGENGAGIYIINANGSNPINIERNTPNEILAVNNDRVYWNTLVDRPQGNRHFETYYLWWTNLDGSETGKLTYNGEQISMSNFSGPQAVFSPDSTKIAWVDAATPADAPNYNNYLHIALLSDTEHPLTINDIEPGIYLKWRLDGKSLLATYDQFAIDRSDPNRIDYGFYEISADSGDVLRNYGLPIEILGAGNALPMQCGDISPDNQLLPCLTFGAENNADGLRITKLNLLNLETGVMSEVNGFSFLFMGWDARNISWIP